MRLVSFVVETRVSSGKKLLFVLHRPNHGVLQDCIQKGTKQAHTSIMLGSPSKASRISSVVATSASTSPLTLSLPSGDALAATPGKAPAAEPWM